MLKHLDLFSGIGGFALACQWAGIETIGFVEIDKYCQKVLRKHWSDVPIVEDIRNVKEIKQIVAHSNQNSKPELPNNENKGQRQLVQTRNNERESPTILITAGFPCQPFSVAGRRQGERDDRYLWPETLAVIEAIKPCWVLLENVTGIINLALDQVLSDLEGADYSTETLIIPACAINAWHRRDRIWIVAWYSKGNRSYQERGFQERQDSLTRRICADVANPKSGQSWEQTEPKGREDSGRGSKEVSIPDTQRERLEGADTKGDLCRTGQPSKYGQGEWQADWWTTEPELGRVAYGIPNRVDRLKSLGNAIVPQVAYEIIKAIMSFEVVE